ncbi:enoyl-CoA hydratase [Bowmanella denitrificans]|uniref:Enoyl-CoA hydratase n=1 Tax=Bowmanella denitrificans TaxID=366582 RepID=A0ABP3H1D5_9ALTE
MSDILLKKESQVLKILINRPHKKNALSMPMYQHMAMAIEQAKEDNEIRAILIASTADDFTAGNDLADFADFSEHEQIGDTVRFMNALMHCPLPVVAKVQGLAVGIGTTMLLHCDLVYCADNSRFSLPFINLGLVPEYASSYLLPKLAGHAKAAQWLMLGESFYAEDAKAFGMVNQVFNLDQLDIEVDKVLAKLVAKPRQAMALTKALMKSNLEEVNLHMNEELDFFIEQLRTPAAKEAFAAFLQKRQPDPDIYN